VFQSLHSQYQLLLNAHHHYHQDQDLSSKYFQNQTKSFIGRST
jgi:hypothetical protein